MRPGLPRGSAGRRPEGARPPRSNRSPRSFRTRARPLWGHWRGDLEEGGLSVGARSRRSPGVRASKRPGWSEMGTTATSPLRPWGLTTRPMVTMSAKPLARHQSATSTAQVGRRGDHDRRLSGCAGASDRPSRAADDPAAVGGAHLDLSRCVPPSSVVLVERTHDGAPRSPGPRTNGAREGSFTFAASALRAGLALQQAAHGVGGLGPLADPVGRALPVRSSPPPGSLRGS